VKSSIFYPRLSILSPQSSVLSASFPVNCSNFGVSSNSYCKGESIRVQVSVDLNEGNSIGVTPRL